MTILRDLSDRELDALNSLASLIEAGRESHDRHWWSYDNPELRYKTAHMLRLAQRARQGTPYPWLAQRTPLRRALDRFIWALRWRLLVWHLPPRWLLELTAVRGQPGQPRYLLPRSWYTSRHAYLGRAYEMLVQAYEQDERIGRRVLV